MKSTADENPYDHFNKQQAPLILPPLLHVEGAFINLCLAVVSIDGPGAATKPNAIIGFC